MSEMQDRTSSLTSGLNFNFNLRILGNKLYHIIVANFQHHGGKVGLDRESDHAVGVFELNRNLVALSPLRNPALEDEVFAALREVGRDLIQPDRHLG